MSLRPLIAICASTLLLSACGGKQSAPPVAATPHLAEWYLVATCTFGAAADGYWSNPVEHEIVRARGAAAAANLPSGACDPDAASPD